jgi:hypothetical protein
MQIIMEDTHIDTIDQLREFLSGAKKLVLRLCTIEEKYQFIDDTVDRLEYGRRKKKEKRVIIRYLKKLTGYKHTQLFRLIDRSLVGDLVRKPYVRKVDYQRIYTPGDIKLLEKTDELHFRLNAHATHEIIRREFVLFHHSEFSNLSGISVSHIDNLRKRPSYRASWVNGTKSREVPIGITMKPEANDHPGSIRVDTVHQRDIYHINAVDEITQWEVLVCVPVIAESCLLPALQQLLDQFPFTVFNFHSDRGSEFINRLVAHLLNKLLIFQTKSRSRHCNDNALVESKNGSIVRKNMGYTHMNQEMADKTNIFYQTYFNPYLNFHRPCGYVTETLVDHKGRKRNVYGHYTTPYEKLKEISTVQNTSFLKTGQSFEKLDTIAYAMSDNEFVKIMREKQNALFEENIAYHNIR